MLFGVAELAESHPLILFTDQEVSDNSAMRIVAGGTGEFLPLPLGRFVILAGKRVSITYAVARYVGSLPDLFMTGETDLIDRRFK
jgi:hypothetical protein